MASNSSIEWTDATWNIVIGCTKVSAGCDNCYAIPTTQRNLTQLRVTVKSAKALSTLAAHEKAVFLGKDGKPRWTGKVGLIPEKLSEPFGWREHGKSFVSGTKGCCWLDVDGKTSPDSSNGMSMDTYAMINVGKHKAGRLLDGVEHNGMPEVTYAS